MLRHKSLHRVPGIGNLRKLPVKILKVIHAGIALWKLRLECGGSVFGREVGRAFEFHHQPLRIAVDRCQPSQMLREQVGLAITSSVDHRCSLLIYPSGNDDARNEKRHPTVFANRVRVDQRKRRIISRGIERGVF